LDFCGTFIIPEGATFVVGEDVVLTIAGNMVVSSGGNLTILGENGKHHGVINFVEDCGLAGLEEAIKDQPQFELEQLSTVNVQYLNWETKAEPYDADEYEIWINATRCVNIAGGDFYMAWIVDFPLGSTPFPFIHTACALGNTEENNNDTDFQLFHELFPVDLPYGCSNIEAYPYTDSDDVTEVYIVINRKDLCFNQIVTMGVFIPAGGLFAAAAAWFLWPEPGVQQMDYVSL